MFDNIHNDRARTQYKIAELLYRQGRIKDGQHVGDDAQLVDDLGMDSYDKIELILLMETEFGIEIKDDDYPSTMTFGQLTDKIEAIVNAKLK
jgi:acyl carrier protein